MKVSSDEQIYKLAATRSDNKIPKQSETIHSFLLYQLQQIKGNALDWFFFYGNTYQHFSCMS